jgi:hypothetical protein
MSFFFDDPRAFYTAPDDEDDLHEVFNAVASGIHHRGPPIDEEHLLPKGAPPVTAWRPLSDTSVSITVDQAREESCEQAQREIDFIKGRAKDVMGTGDDVPSRFDIAEYFYGERSRLYRCFAQEIEQLDGKLKLFQRCVGTFFLSCTVDMPLEEMHENGMFPGLLAPEDEYLYFWNLILLADATNRSTSI